MRFTFSFLVLILVFTVVAPAFSGVYFEGTTRSSAGSIQDKSIIYLNPDRMRVENRERQGSNIPETIIFRQDKKVMWLINESDGTYSEITQEDLETMKSKMDEGMKMMQEQMKNMPPEQRKMMEEMMAKQMPKQMMEQEITTYKKTASDVPFKSWSCEKYTGFQNGKQTAEVLTITPSQAGFEKEDFLVMRAFSEFFTPLSMDANEFLIIGSESDAKSGGFNGMPVKYINMENGKVTDTFELDKIESRTNPAALFELPENLKKKDLW